MNRQRAAGDDRVRVLTLIDKPIAIGGAERLAVDLAIALDPSRFDRYFFSTRWSPYRLLDDELRAAGVEYHSLERRSRYDLIAWRRLLELLRRERIDVVHTHLFGSNVWGSVFGRLARVPAIVAHEHSWSYVARPFRKLADRHVVARFSDVMIAVSQADAQKMASIEHIPPSKIKVIRNGIHQPRVTADGDDVRRALGIPGAAFVVCAVAVIRPEKRLDRLIEAAVLLRERVPGAVVLVAGAGYPEEMARLERLVDEHRAGDVIRFLGERSDAPNLIAASDIGILTSDREGIPLSLLEFMALEKPVVATRVGGIPEVVTDGETGLLVRELTPSGVADAVTAMARMTGEERASMGAAARARQQQDYTFEAYVRQISELYSELLASRGGARG
jgi:glycosyltransferase involved in cell wall biosynthesis